MKSQDFVFVVLLLILIVFARNKPRLFIVLGQAFILLAIPLFAYWVFFTAERLVWYSAALIFLALLLIVYSLFKNKSKASK